MYSNFTSVLLTTGSAPGDVCELGDECHFKKSYDCNISFSYFHDHSSRLCHWVSNTTITLTKTLLSQSCFLKGALRLQPNGRNLSPLELILSTGRLLWPPFKPLGQTDLKWLSLKRAFS